MSDMVYGIKNWRGWLSRSLDLLYPPSCVICQVSLSHGRSLCGNCNGDLTRLTEPFCGVCSESFEGQIEGSFTCQNCSRLKFSFEFARSAMVRDDRTLGMIHRLKYRREIHLAKDLGQLAAEAFTDPRLAPALAGKWPLVPVPLHRRRLQHRHFNQAEEISRQLAVSTGLPWIGALRRIRRTEHQTALTRVQRLANLRGAFAISETGRRWSEKSPAGVVLVDDVLTTGSTVNECAKVLRRAGFKQVVVVTVMRG
jgi:competence protein ComFC